MPTSQHIAVRGAAQNNLVGVDVDIPKHQLVVFTGVSGSGKSSLVFGTIAAESRRLLNETYSSFVQMFMATQARPDVDTLEGLTAAIAVGQEPMAGDVRSTVGTATDANAMLRIVYSRIAEPVIGGPSAYAFNVPSVSGAGSIRVGEGAREVRRFEKVGGMCPRCEGRGEVSDIDLSKVIHFDRTLSTGALTQIPGYTVDGWATGAYAEAPFLDADKRIEDFSDQELHDLLHKEETKVQMQGMNRTYLGLLVRLRQSMFGKERDSLQPHVRRFVDEASTLVACPACDGHRLAEATRASLVRGLHIGQLCAMQVDDLAAWVAELDDPRVAPVLRSLQGILAALVDVGLGYLSLDRPTSTLSGGESQRVRMVRHLGSPLTDVTYVFDEPTVGLHAHDVDRMVALLHQLRDKGNTVLVVEHEPAVIEAADTVIDMGPGAGQHGGQVVFQGDLTGLREAGTHTGEHLDHRTPVRAEAREATGAIRIEGASLHNLRDVTVDVPTGVLVAVTGVAGSGKSSLIDGCLPRDEGTVVVDQTSIQGSRRSNPATYTGIFDDVRRAFARANDDATASMFSFNSDGACPECNGLGVIETRLGVMESVETRCELCEGRRYSPDVLQFRLRGRDVAQVLEMPVDEALDFFTEKKVVAMLTSLRDVGLGYVRLGQALNTLSGGERQRLKLAIEMAGEAEVYVLDEPTSGLHMADVDRLVTLLDRLVDEGRSVIVVEHDLDLIARADWVIDMGPGAGSDGGTVVFEGPPAALARHEGSLTGRHLAEGRDIE